MVVVPWPTGLTDVSFIWATNIVIWILGAAGVLLFLAPLALALWMGIRHFKLEVRYYQGNSTFRLIVNVATALGAGLLGSLLFMYLLDRLGIAPISGKWFDIVPALWPLAFLIAYATALLIQVFIVHYRNRDYTVVNIAHCSNRCCSRFSTCILFVVLFPCQFLIPAIGNTLISLLPDIRPALRKLIQLLISGSRWG